MKHQIKVQVYFLTENQGGRVNPFGSGFNPKIKFSGSIEEFFTELYLNEDDVIFPGDNVKLELVVKEVSDCYLYRGGSFDLMEGNHKIAEGSLLFVKVLD